MDIVKNITASSQTVPMFVGDGTGTVTAHCKGIFTGSNCIFEASIDSETGLDGTWFAIQALRSNANTAEATTGVLAARPAYAWEFSVASYRYIRVRATAFTSGTQTWTLKGHPGSAENMPFFPPVVVSGAATTTPVNPTTHFLSSAATTNATSVKATAGNLYAVVVTNQNAASRCLKLYNKATAPTVGTDVPKMTIQVPANSAVSLNLGPVGVRFDTGIALAMTTLGTIADTTAVAVNDLESCLSYI